MLDNRLPLNYIFLFDYAIACYQEAPSILCEGSET
jgi:hypothetical protein